MAAQLLLLALLAVVAQACNVPPGACTESICNSYKGLVWPDEGLNYSRNNTWTSQPIMSKIAFYKGVANKVIKIPPQPNTYAKWKATRGTPSLNLEKFNPENSYRSRIKNVPAGAGGDLMGLSECCNRCRKREGCAMFMWYPGNSQAGVSLDSGGKCYSYRGGSYTKDGPYNNDGTLLGTPDSSSPNSGSDIGILGGFCNPIKSVTDDPHFVGAHGTPYDFNGELDKSFCLITDAKFHINAMLKGYRSTNTFGATVQEDGSAIRSWIREMAFMWEGGNTLHLVARDGKQQERGDGFIASATINGKPFQIPADGDSVTVGDLTFTNLGAGTKGPYDVESFQVVIGDYLDVSFSLRVAHKLLQTEKNAYAHFNLMFNGIRASEKVHGVLGQTYRNTPSQLMKALKYSELSRLLGEPIRADGDSGKGFLDGVVQDYESTVVTKADCKVSSFVQ